MPYPRIVTDDLPVSTPERRANPDSLATALEGMAFLRIGHNKWYDLVDQGILSQPIKMGPSRNSAARWRWRDIYAVPAKLETIDWSAA